MTLQLCHFQGNHYVFVDHSDLKLAFSVNCLGDLSRSLIDPKGLEIVETYEAKDSEIPIVEKINKLFGKYVENLRKIANKFNLEIMGEGLEYCANFKKIIIQKKITKVEELDLSNLDLDLVPFLIGLFTEIKKLDLSDNKIRVIPPDIQKLEKLEYINLKGNPFIHFPQWINEKIRSKQLLIETDLVSRNSESLEQERL